MTTPDLATLDYLTSPDGAALLARLATQDLSDAHTLALLTRLRREHPPAVAAAALELARLRRKARDKFGDDADRLYFTRDALEQASDPHIRAYRARHAPAQVIDAGCGIGADALAYARAGSHVLGLDIDPDRVALARANARALGLADRARFAVADARAPLPHRPDLVFFDPARRTADGRRIHDVRQYLPPLATIAPWHDLPVLVKLSPGVDLAQLDGYGGTVEFIAVGHDLKEALLHRPPGAVGTPARRATQITVTGDGAQVTHWERTHPPEPRPLSAPRAWLIEPSPAILRAGLVQDLAQALDAHQLDPTIAYLTTDHAPASVWAAGWQIEAWMPFHVKKLRAYLRERDIGQVTVKKRGSPVTPEQLITQLKLKGGSGSRTLALTRYDGQAIVIVCADRTPDNLL